MITIIYSTNKDSAFNSEFKKHLLSTCSLKDPQIIEYINHNEFSLSELYNRGIEEAKFDIVVCLHNDVRLENNWGNKLLKIFVENTEYAIIGLAGTANFPTSGVYWSGGMTNMAGRVYHKIDGKKKLTDYSVKSKDLFPVASIDGLFISFNKNKIIHRFDETMGKFNFYDHAFCLANYISGVKIGVTTNFEITHESIGLPNENFETDRGIFLEKYGEFLPIDLKPNKVAYDNIKAKPIKNVGKTAVIIPTKGKVDMLKSCINSYLDIVGDSVPYEIFIADTGSTEEELSEIELFIKNSQTSTKIHLLKYNYYNFAKINNDVVKNHVGTDFEYILFSNNDIKLLNNVVYGMVNVFRTRQMVGTVGPRMHFGNNTVQHNGILAAVNQAGQLIFTHLNLGTYYHWNSNLNKVFGNTAGLMMIKRSIFLSCGMFNETYKTCFEDVELNAECALRGLNNYNDGSLVAYHYESQTRNDDESKLVKSQEDYLNTLIPFMQKWLAQLINKKIIHKIVQ